MLIQKKTKMKELKKCPECNSYTLQDTHCNTKTKSVYPPKYSPEDKYGKYRREAKKCRQT